MLKKIHMGLIVSFLALVLSACDSTTVIVVTAPPPNNGGEQQNQQPPQRASVTYTITVRTGTIDKGGTDADVYIELLGTNGNSGLLYLDTPNYNDFERGDNDPYAQTLSNLGEIVGVCIQHDNSGDGAGWFLEDIHIKSDEGKEWFFHFGQWLADDEPPGQLKACKYK